MSSPLSYGNGLVIELADDVMSATITLNREENENPLTEEETLKALESADIVIDESVEKKVSEFVNLITSKKDPAEPFVVVKGVPRYEGQDETFQWDSVFEEKKNEWQDDAQVNYYNLSNIITVPEDTLIGTILPMKPQKNGLDITGKTLKPRERPPVAIKIDHTVKQDPDDPAKIISNISGRVDLSNNAIHMDEVLEIKGDVGFGTGNIDSDVAVHITGVVPDRFEVKSKKSITVEMAIEAALVIAGQDVTVRRGIVGRSAGKVQAAGNIVAKYYSEANLIAGGDILIASQLLNCHVRAEGKIIGTHASILGGFVYAKMGCEVTELGTDVGTPTRIFIGICPAVLGESAAIDSSLQAKRNTIKRIRERVQPLLDNVKKLAPAQREQATELMFKAQEAEMQIEEEEEKRRQLLDEAKETNDDNQEDESSPVKLSVSGTIYPDVTISIGSRMVMFRNELKGPIAIEERKIRNVTEIVAVNSLTGSVQVLNSRKLTEKELLKDYEPIKQLDNIKLENHPAEQAAN